MTATSKSRHLLATLAVLSLHFCFFVSGSEHTPQQKQQNQQTTNNNNNNNNNNNIEYDLMISALPFNTTSIDLHSLPNSDDDSLLHNLRNILWRMMPGETGSGRCTVERVPCASECVVAPKGAREAEAGYCLTTLGTAGECLREIEHCFVVDMNHDCPMTLNNDTNRNAMHPCSVQEGDSDFQSVRLTSTIHLPLFPSTADRFIGRPETTDPSNAIAVGPNALLFDDCLAGLLGLSGQDVAVTLALPQRQGIVISFDVYVAEPSKVRELRDRLQNILNFNDGRELCEACALAGLSGLLGARLVVLQPVVVTYGGALPFLRLDRLAILPTHTSLSTSRPHIGTQSSFFISFVVGMNGDELDLRRTRRAFRDLSRITVAPKGISSLALFSQECRDSQVRFISVNTNRPDCKYTPLQYEILDARPYAFRKVLISITMSHDQWNHMWDICGNYNCLMTLPEGSVWDNGMRTNEPITLEEITPLRVEWWAIHQDTPMELSKSSFRIPPSTQSHFSVRIKFSEPVDVNTFVSRRFAIGQTKTASRFKQILGHNLNATHVITKEGVTRKDIVVIPLHQPESNAVVDIIQNIRAGKKKAYLVVAERGISNLKRTNYIDAFGPIDESGDCMDATFEKPTYDVDSSISQKIGKKKVPVDYCSYWNKDASEGDCGVGAANVFCRANSFTHSIVHSGPIAVARLTTLSNANATTQSSYSTMTLDATRLPSGICDGSRLSATGMPLPCQTFGSITCCAPADLILPAAHPRYCIDSPIDWVDSIGHKCSVYEKYPWKCQMSSEFQVQGELGAAKACCACGGGNAFGKLRPEVVAFTMSNVDGMVVYFDQLVRLKKNVQEAVSMIHLMRSVRDEYHTQILAGVGTSINILDSNFIPSTSVGDYHDCSFAIQIKSKQITEIMNIRKKDLEGASGRLLYLWIESGFVESPFHTLSFGNTEHLVKETPKLRLTAFHIERLPPPQSKNDPTAISVEQETSSVVSVPITSLAAQQPQVNQEPDAYHVVIEFSAPVLASTLDVSKINVLTQKKPISQMALTGGRTLLSEEPSKEVRIALATSHPLAIILQQNDKTQKDLLASQQELQQTLSEQSKRKPPNPGIDTVKKNLEVATNKLKEFQDSHSHTWMYVSYGSVREAGGPVWASAMEVTESVQDSSMVDGLDDQTKTSIMIKTVSLVYRDSTGTEQSATSLDERNLGMFSIYELISPSVVRIVKIKVEFFNGPAVMRIARFDSERGWVWDAIDDDDSDDGCDESSNFDSGKRIKKIRNPMESPIEAQLPFTVKEGANVFLIGLTGNDPTLPGLLEYYFGLVVVRTCGESSFPEPKFPYGDTYLQAGGHNLLSNAQENADSFCRYQRKKNAPNVCGNDLAVALNMYSADNADRSWRKGPVRYALMRNTIRWCNGVQLEGQDKVCQTGVPDKMDCSKPTLTEPQTAASAATCTELLTSAQTQECCYVFQAIECDALRATELSITSVKFTPAEIAAQSINPSTIIPDSPIPFSSGTPQHQEIDFRADNFIYYINKKEFISAANGGEVGVVGLGQDEIALQLQNAEAAAASSSSATVVTPKIRFRVAGQYRGYDKSPRISQDNEPACLQCPKHDIPTNDIFDDVDDVVLEDEANQQTSLQPSSSTTKPHNNGPRVRVTGEFETGIATHGIDFLVNGPLRIVPLLNIVLVTVQQHPHQVQYAIMIAGSNDRMSARRRQVFLMEDLALSRDEITILQLRQASQKDYNGNAITTTENGTVVSASAKSDNGVATTKSINTDVVRALRPQSNNAPPVYWAHCLEDDQGDGVCGMVSANEFCQIRFGQPAIGLQAYAEAMGERVAVEATRNFAGKMCEAGCYSFESITCSTF